MKKRKVAVLFPEMTLRASDRRKRARRMAAITVGANDPTKRQIRRLPDRPTKSGLRKQRKAIRRIMRKQGLEASYFE
jgi:hypothetical protein